MSDKACFKCGRTLDIEMFYKHPRMSDGRLGKCKDCTRRDVSRNRSLRSDYYNEFDRKRARLPHRVASRAKYSSDLGYAKKKMYYGASISRYPYKQQARQATAYAIKRGEIQKQPCSVCGNQKSQAHHEDYTDPLNVIWFCSKHHAARHRELEAIARILISEKNWCNGW